MIAQTILQQIGGKRFTAMTGSRDYINMGNGLRMSLARNKEFLHLSYERQSLADVGGNLSSFF